MAEPEADPTVHLRRRDEGEATLDLVSDVPALRERRVRVVNRARALSVPGLESPGARNDADLDGECPMSDPAPNVGVFHSILPKAALSILSAAIVFALTGCASHNFTSSDEYANYSSSDEYADDAVSRRGDLRDSRRRIHTPRVAHVGVRTGDRLHVRPRHLRRDVARYSIAELCPRGLVGGLRPIRGGVVPAARHSRISVLARRAGPSGRCRSSVACLGMSYRHRTDVGLGRVCWTTFDSLDPNEAADNKRYTPTGRTMLREGQQIDSTYTLDTADEMWLSIQSQNCDVAQSLGAGSDGTATWYIPTGTPSYPSPTYDVHTLLEASVAASLVTGCPEYLDPAWQEKWPAMWRNISGNLGGSSSGTTGGWSGGGGTVICSDGWVSHSGGKQGACSWHGGVG